MANAFLNSQVYANVMLLLLKNSLVWGRLVDGQFKDQVTNENGLAISVKKPPRFVATSGASLKAQDVVTGSVPISVTEYKNVHISIGDLEYVQSFNDLLKNETLKSAAVTLATDVDKFISRLTLGFHSWVSGGNTDVAGSDALSNATLLTKSINKPQAAFAAPTRLMAQGVPNANISGVLGYGDGELIRGALLSDFTPDVNRTALEKTRIPLISEVDWYSTQQIPTLSTGTRTQGNGSSTGSQVSGANQNVNYRDVKGSGLTAGNIQTLNITGTTAQTIEAGAVFTIAGVYAWDWRQQVKLPYLQQFTVLTAATVVSSAAALSITPAIIVQGTSDGVNTYANSAFATVDSVPADNAYIQFAGAPSINVPVRSVFHKRALALVSARLEMPFTGVASFATDPDTGISIRYWRGSDITTGQHVHRWDMIYGGACMDTELGTRLIGPNS
jgi:hypothetical protein